MWEGFFINYNTGKTVCIGLRNDHARWIAEAPNAEKLGVVIAKTKFHPINNRDEFLLHILRLAPVMRIRGHGLYVTFEFDSKTMKQPYRAINQFSIKYLVPVRMLHIVNWAFRPPRVLDIFVSLFWAKMRKRK
ncbi:MAG: hypothetical protein PHR77_04710 [Kiritimatiellae bacterium]|nr:hypothetical protein [Kiritimatiellia bacterium]MDD5519471.1 hypothetical protein [Kiritimatiellia bacterium]